MEVPMVISLMSEIRSFVNDSRKKTQLIKDTAKFNQLMACLDLVEDCEYAIQSYTQNEFKDFGDTYLRIYGLFQTFVMQQDAVRYLHLSLNNNELDSFYENPDLREIRRIRNLTVGHAVNNYENKFSQIIRSNMSLDKFDVIYRNLTDTSETKTIVTKEIILKQSNIISNFLSLILNKLESEFNEHISRFKNEKLSDSLIENIDYLIEKLVILDISEKYKAKSAFNLIVENIALLKLKIMDRIEDEINSPQYEYVFGKWDTIINHYNMAINNGTLIEIEAFARLIAESLNRIKKIILNLDEYYQD